MSMPFSRPGAIDLSALKNRPPTGQHGGPPAAAPAAAPAGAAGAGPGGTGPSSYTVDVDEQNFQALLEQSLTAPVLLCVFSASRLPASAQLADDLDRLVEEMEGRYLLGLVDIDRNPTIAQALQVQAVPLVAMVLQGRLQPLFQEVPPIDEVRALLTQVQQQLATQGMTGRHQPLHAAVEETTDEPAFDPRYAAAEDALVAGDIDTAVAEYEKLIAANPADVEAVIGLGRAKLMQRTAGADLNAARAAAAAAPDDVDAQILVADLDLLGGHVEDSFARLIELVRRTSGADRDRARLHLIELFTVVGDDPRVLKARQGLASALF